MFRWPGEPSPSDKAHELADYVELVFYHSTDSSLFLSTALNSSR